MKVKYYPTLKCSDYNLVKYTTSGASRKLLTSTTIIVLIHIYRTFLSTATDKTSFMLKPSMGFLIFIFALRGAVMTQIFHVLENEKLAHNRWQNISPFISSRFNYNRATHFLAFQLRLASLSNIPHFHMCHNVSSKWRT